MEIKRQKMAQDDKTFCLLHFISGTIHHMIVIYGPFVQNDDISRYSFHFKILIFQVIREVKR